MVTGEFHYSLHDPMGWTSGWKDSEMEYLRVRQNMPSGEKRRL